MNAVTRCLAILLVLCVQPAIGDGGFESSWLEAIRLDYPKSCEVRLSSVGQTISGNNGLRIEQWSLQTCLGPVEYRVSYYPSAAFPTRKSPFEIQRLSNGLGTLSPAGATLVECPSKLAVVSAGQAPTGWEAIPSTSEHRLNSITVYDGPPNEHASLAPISLPASGGFEVAQWGVRENGWLECSYGGTNATVAKQIPSNFKSCKAYYVKSKRGVYSFARFECE